MATILLWYHDGALTDNNGLPTPVINEPSVLTDDLAETVTTPAASNPAPDATSFAVIETDARVRYTVRRAGEATPNANSLHKYIDIGQGQIAVRPGQTIDFIEG